VSSWPVQIPVDVRERDCGADGRLDESVLLVYFREARRAYVSVLNADDLRLRLTEMGLNVHREIHLDDELQVAVRCEQVDERGLTMAYQVRDKLKSELVADGHTQLIFTDEWGDDRPVPVSLRVRIDVLEGRHG
jgi:acyl-CoA thioesterase FadM